MREINFRVWDKVHKHFLDGDIIRDYIIGELIDDPDREVIQYTEVRDSEGIEIFDGDICKRMVYAFGEVRTFVGRVMMFEGCWWIDSGTAAVPLWNEMHILEVIGNIYENPELLETMTK